MGYLRDGDSSDGDISDGDSNDGDLTSDRPNIAMMKAPPTIVCNTDHIFQIVPRWEIDLQLRNDEKSHTGTIKSVKMNEREREHELCEEMFECDFVSSLP